ncbi:predicted protein [Coccidioides posadasii str. Silveira]|uniref:Predicted protein n=1 Tax=Coccidioides posadasii (strain RMSCC 757 / Silveira) TaxID=443226 RepID=E9CT75_COCPS|nr:predicted protein [Coccidioides posadasii str. Silveira]
MHASGFRSQDRPLELGSPSDSYRVCIELPAAMENGRPGPQKDANGGSIESSTIDNQCMHGNVSGPWLGSFLPLPEIDIITKFAQ